MTSWSGGVKTGGWRVKNRSKFSALRPHYERGREERTVGGESSARGGHGRPPSRAAATAGQKKGQNKLGWGRGDDMSRHSRRPAQPCGCTTASDCGGGMRWEGSRLLSFPACTQPCTFPPATPRTRQLLLKAPCSLTPRSALLPHEREVLTTSGPLRGFSLLPLKERASCLA